MIALRLDKDKRILSACTVLLDGNYDGMPIVEALPQDVQDGKENIRNYLYIDSQYIYDPLPEPEPVEPEPERSVWDELDEAYQEGVDSL